MKYGNCLIGAIVLMVKRRTWKIRCVRGQYLWFHFFVIDNNNRAWHYTELDIDNASICPLIYSGRFEDCTEVLGRYLKMKNGNV
jgi:hypothetical protein